MAVIENKPQDINSNNVQEASYERGLQDGVALWGAVCGSQANCKVCPIGVVRGAGVTCQDFAMHFPQKFISILKDMNQQDYTYFDEYCSRFPESNLNVDDLMQVACRKAIFEGYLECKGGNCKDCWLETYTDDVTVDYSDVTPESVTE